MSIDKCNKIALFKDFLFLWNQEKRAMENKETNNINNKNTREINTRSIELMKAGRIEDANRQNLLDSGIWQPRNANMFPSLKHC